MHTQIASLLLGATTLVSAFPTVIEKRTVTALNQAAFEEAQPRDNTATRAFSAIEIKTSSGQCLFVDELSGDFRANLNPIQVGDCDGSTGQSWDIITAGAHNNAADSMLLVNTLTQACCNFDPRRAAGNQVIMFSCGGRADGGGLVTNSQLFPFTGGSGPLTLSPENAAGTCFTVTGAAIDQAPCADGNANQSFTFGDGGAVAGNGTASATATPTAVASATATASATAPAETDTGDDGEQNTCGA